MVLTKSHTLVFPVSVSSKDKDGAVFSHEVVGGITMRDYIAIEFAKGMFSNPALINGATASAIRSSALEQANRFCEDLASQT
jgi:hypothetical protein